MREPISYEKAIDKLQKLSKLTSSKEVCELAIQAIREKQKYEQAMPRVREILGEMRNGATMPTLGALEARLDEYFKS